MNGNAAALIGTSVGEFGLSAVLDQDGRSVIYRAEHLRLHSPCACKILNANPATDGKSVEEFLALARAMSRAHHPSIVDIFDVGTLPDGRPYYVMELLQGRQLAARLADSSLHVMELGQIAMGVCGALQAAHGAGLTHDNLSTARIFVEQRENRPTQVKLFHFRSGAPDVPAAIAAVGALVQQMCGRTGSVPSSLRQVVQRAIQPTPQAHFESVQALAAAIEQATQRGATGLGRRRQIFLGLALGMVVGIPLLGVGIHRLITHRQTATENAAGPSLRTLYRLAIQTLQEGLRASDSAVRKKALQALQQAPEVRFRDRIEPLLDDGDQEVQAQAALALGRLGSRGAIAPLLTHAQTLTTTERDLSFKAACGEALLRLGEPGGKKLLVEVLRSNAPADSKLAAGLALESHDDPAGRAFLDLELAKKNVSTENTLRILAVRAQRLDNAAISALTDRARPTGNPTADNLRAAALLLPLERGTAREELRAAAKTGSLQLLAAHALCMADDASFHKLLAETVRDKNRSSDEREQAASGLGVCGDRSAAQTLALVLKNQQEPATLRQSVAGALLRLASVDPQVIAEQNVNFARVALTDDNWTVRESAMTLLGEMLKPAGRIAAEVKTAGEPVVESVPEAVQLLSQAIGDTRAEVRLAALRASGELGSRLMSPDGRNLDKESVLKLRQILTQRSTQGDEAERVVASAMLARLGTGTPEEKLELGLRATDPAARRLAVKEAAATGEIPVQVFVKLLNDSDFEVRFLAACALAKRGQRNGLPVLLQALKLGGAHRERAVLMLALLDEPIPADMALTPERIAEMLSNQAPLTRLEALEALPRLKLEIALELLLRAVRDVDPAVRWRVAEVAAELSKKPRGGPALHALRLLTLDDDVAVRTHATALLATVHPLKDEPETKPAPEPPPGPLKEDPPAAKPETNPAPTTASKPTSEAHSTKPPTEKAAPSQVQALYAKGSDMLARKDYRGAFKQLERANALCARLGEERAVCDRLGSDLAFHLAQAYESQGQWSNAMAEYQTVSKRGRAAQQSAAHGAIARMAARLGKVVLFQTQKGKCRPVDVWMEPGNHLLKLGDGSRKAIELKAGDSIEIKSCQ